MTGEEERFAEKIDGDPFGEWYRERKWEKNIREGQPYFNGLSPVPPAEKHSPSSLLQCHRKVFYRQENAPAEREKPEGIFWAGTHFEEDVMVPYLRDVVYDTDAYVRNSMWVDFEIPTEVDSAFQGRDGSLHRRPGVRAHPSDRGKVQGGGRRHR
ncbi:hypothetical protein [Halorubellus litoreus]|uniref:Uncharacterized protein n=1 Tax=Halorubellus litoreus TaxID=755308 RepID=A0ABD5VHU4_9EURY